MVAAPVLDPFVRYAPRSVGPNIALSESEAQRVGEELARLAGNARLTGLQAEQVVDAAKAKTSVLHSYIFQQTDKEAAHRWRCRLAQELIASVMWVPAPAAAPVRAFTMVKTPSRNGYLPTPDARKEPEVIAAKRRHAFKSLRAWLSEFEYWAEPGSDLAATVELVRKALQDAGE
jgi:hypothetical protein